MLGESRAEGARRPQGHQPRRLLRDADGRDAGRRGRRSRRPPARHGRSEGEGAHGRRPAARAGRTTSSTASPSAPAPTCTPRCCTDARAITTSRPCSRRSRARCAWRARRTRGWRRCCRARRGCCEEAPVIALVDYGAGNLTSVRKALTTLGAEFVTPREPAECTERRGARRAGRRPLRRHRGARRARGARRFADAVRGGHAAPRHLRRHAVAVRGQRRGARACRGLGVLPGRIQRLDGDAGRRG